MTPIWGLFAAVVIATAIRTVILGRRHAAHVRYLQAEVRALGGEDRWNVRCTHCGKRMRDAASIRLATRTPAGSGWVEHMDGVFHMDRPACAAAADAVRGAR